ncbi:MAG: GAF domain-containing SpoIIE family protein phosphatase [Candidatus Acidiferrales bacterium]
MKKKSKVHKRSVSRAGVKRRSRPARAAFPASHQSLSLLSEISQEITAILERDELFGRIASRVKKVVDYQLFNVMLWNEKSTQLESVFAVHFGEPIQARIHVPLYKGITGYAAGERKPFRIDDVRKDPRYVGFPNSERVRSELVVPLLLRGRLIGVLDLESTKLAAFSGEHERVLSILGTYIAIALENSRLYATSRENELRLLSDLDTARDIQRQLLPQGPREVPGIELATIYVPARELAGDFYDFLRYGDGCLAIAVGDVSGKGTAAALYASMAVGILREHTADHELTPAEMLATLNGRLCASNISPGFAALLFAQYHVGKRVLNVANAGIPRPILVRDREATELQVVGTPLGIFPETEYETLKIKLKPHDVVIFASDGILESMNAHQEEFGFARLADVLGNLEPNASPEEVAATIMKATDKFSGRPEEPHDDRTLIVLRVAAVESGENEVITANAVCG